jgi:glycosyltransferase involved in cell wall biosynthesis
MLEINDQFILTSNSSKNTIVNYLSKSKYFVYPLINLDNNFIHYDTFAYVVLEALLHGVIVIAPKIAVYEELYGDSICYIDTDDIISKEDLTVWKNYHKEYYSFKSVPNFGYPCVNRYVDKINLLESNPSLRNEYIEKGLKLKDKFSNINITNQFSLFLNK